MICTDVLANPEQLHYRIVTWVSHFKEDEMENISHINTVIPAFLLIHISKLREDLVGI